MSISSLERLKDSTREDYQFSIRETNAAEVKIWTVSCFSLKFFNFRVLSVFIIVIYNEKIQLGYGGINTHSLCDHLLNT